MKFTPSNWNIWAASWQNQQNGMCAQWRLRSARASAQSHQNLRCPHEETLGPQLPIKRTAKTLIRLGGCPGWSESSLDAESFCWFWHEAAHLLKNVSQFLAHLSRRLTRWAYSIAMVRRPSVVVRRRRRPSSVVVRTFKLKYLWSHLANLDQILYVASLGWGKGCIRFWGRFDQNSGFHGNRKLPLAYNGENDVSTFSRLFLIRSILYLQVTRTCIKSRTSSNFGQIGPLTTKLAALKRLKDFP